MKILPLKDSMFLSFNPFYIMSSIRITPYYGKAVLKKILANTTLEYRIIGVWQLTGGLENFLKINTWGLE